MVAFNFMPRFAAKVEDGSKRQTIRSSQRAQTGDPVQLYQGQRTKACRKLGDSVCNAAYPLTLHRDKVQFQAGQFHTLRAPEDLERFAHADGFDSWAELVDFFDNQYGLPYNGWLHGWGALA